MGGLIAAAQQQAAREAWSGLSETKSWCYARAVARAGATIDGLIANGVAPSDPRLRSALSPCNRVTENLRRHFRCSVTDDRGLSVQSWCDQRYARQQGGRLESVDMRGAVEMLLSTGHYQVADFENEVGRLERVQKLEAEARAGEVRRILASVERYGQSRSDVVRAEHALIVRRAQTATGAYSPEAARSDVQRLAQLESSETARLTALDRLTARHNALLRREAAFNDDVRAEFAHLGEEYAALTRPPAPVTTRSLPTRTGRVGPGFDCAAGKRPMEKVICSNAALSRLDLSMLQPFYVLRHLKPDSRSDLRQEAVDLGTKTLQQCRLLDRGSISARDTAAAVPCVSRHYEQQFAIWRAAVDSTGSQDGREEARRPVEQHLDIQLYLREAGYLPRSEQIDGIYGAATRSAVAAFQSSASLPATGLVSDATAAALRDRLQAPERTALADARPVLAQMAGLEQKYAQLDARLTSLEEAARRKARQVEQLQEAARYLEGVARLDIGTQARAEADALLGRIRTALAENDDGALLSLTTEYDQTRRKIEPIAKVAAATTARNSFVLAGDPEDWLLLYNDTGNAPSIIRNLRGDLIFESSRTTICRADRDELTRPALRAINERLKPFNQTLPRQINVCGAGDLLKFDLVLSRKGGLIKDSTAALALLSAVDSGAFASMLSVTGDDIRTGAEADGVRVAQIESWMAKGDRGGFALALVQQVRSKTVCAADIGETAPHERALAAHRGLIEDELNGAPALLATNADAAFISAKRGQCGAVYGPAAVLRELLAALKRDQIDMRLLPVWVERLEVEAAVQAMAEARRRDIEQEAERRQRAEDAERLASVKNNEASVVRARRQAELRTQYGAAAKSFENALAREMKALFEDRSRREANKYSEIDRWFADLLADKWELVSLNTELIDFGIATFKERQLEAGFARTSVRLRNRILGEYKDGCFATGFIMDKEFEMEREPFASACDAADERLGRYNVEQRFSSNWIVR